MKKYLAFVVLLLISFGSITSNAEAREWKKILDSLTTIDPEIRQYFPRWKVCEPDLQLQIYTSFVMRGDTKDSLNMQRIEVLAAPRVSLDDTRPYELLLVTCGEKNMTSLEIEENIGYYLIGFLTGEMYYSGKKRFEEQTDRYKRDYCYEDIPVEIPLTTSQTEAIVNFLEPTNVTHSVTLSLFAQTLKIGTTGFWLSSIIGTDQIGYPFWSSGEGRIVLKRPLYPNLDYKTMRKIPNLINAYLGVGYRINNGLSDDNSVLSWLANRKLNAGPGGKMIGGFDFHMPFHPQFGIQLNTEIPLRETQDEAIEKSNYWIAPPRDDVSFIDFRTNVGQAPILRSTGQATLFYNWWLNDYNPENYFRIDLGLGYAEVRELACYDVETGKGSVRHMTADSVVNLKTYKPNEFGDWLYLKLEYRNQAAWPFGVSMQYSNQILLGRIYIPIFGDWLYIEGKFSTPLRGIRPYEINNFFMVSPVLRITI